MKMDTATNIKNNFGSVLDRVKAGETVTVLEYGRPVAQISKVAVADESEVVLSALEREGLLSLRQNPPLNVKDFLSTRIRLKKSKASILESLLKDRLESV